MGRTYKDTDREPATGRYGRWLGRARVVLAARNISAEERALIAAFAAGDDLAAQMVLAKARRAEARAYRYGGRS